MAVWLDPKEHLTPSTYTAFDTVTFSLVESLDGSLMCHRKHYIQLATE